MSRRWWEPDDRVHLLRDEKVLLRTRHHWMMAIFPFIYTSLLATLLTFAFDGSSWLATAVFIALAVHWVRAHGLSGQLGLLATTVAVAAGWVVILLLGLEARFVGLLILGALLYSANAVAQYWVTWIYVTDRRILRVSGILTRRRSTLAFKALTDLRYDKPLLGRMLDYGHFFVESAGQRQALSEVRFVDRPQRFYRAVMAEALGGQIIPPLQP